MKKVIVSGGSGFVAAWVIAEFLNQHYAVATSLRSLSKAEAIKDGLSHRVRAADLANLSFFEADLTSKDGWTDAMRGADGVIHVASPMGNGTESTEELVNVAKSGVLNILQAAADAGVKRVVMTSSQAACTPKNSATGTFNEEFWTDPENPELDSYRISKVLAEKAAWDFANQNNLDLTTVLPGAIFGPVITRNLSSNRILLQLLKGQPVLPKAPLEISDVRDLARLHRLAFENPTAIGKRYGGSSQTLTMLAVGKTYQAAFPLLHLHVHGLPDWTVRAAAKFVPSLRTLVPLLNRQYHHSTAAAEKDLGWQQHIQNKPC